MKIAAIIKHPYRDFDYRIDIIDVPDDFNEWDKLKEQLEYEMLGPFQVLALTTKINFDRKFILQSNTK